MLGLVAARICPAMVPTAPDRGTSPGPRVYVCWVEARGVPFGFRAYEVERPGGSWERVERSIPASDERIRSVPEAPGLA